MKLLPQLKTLYGVIAVLIAIVIIVSSIGGLYFVKYTQVSSDNSIYLKQLEQLNVKYETNVLIDYGNGTHTWYNDTMIQPGSNLYAATVSVTDGNVNATCCEFGAHFVTGIGGVQNTNSEFWFLWAYDQSNATSPWQMAQVGADQITVLNGSVFAWTFCGMTSTYEPNCSPA